MARGEPVTSKLTEVLIDCADAERLAAFWCAVLDWEVIERSEGDVEIGDGTSKPTIVFELVPERKSVKNRIHLDLKAVDGDQAAEVERIIVLGAERVDVGQGDVSWVVLADPEGNEFCVLAGKASSLAHGVRSQPDGRA
jgi:catechol-2,3-dioxygenase